MRPTALHPWLFTALLLSTSACKSTPKPAPKPQVDLSQYEGAVFQEGFSAQVFPDRVQASRDASTLGGNCSGFITENPVLIANIIDEMPARIFVSAEVDTVLAIQTPSGAWLCDDDFDHHDPSLHRTWPVGRYEIHVGTASAQEDAFDYELSFYHYNPATPLEARPSPK